MKPLYKKGDILYYKDRNAVLEVLQCDFIEKTRATLYNCKYILGDNRFVRYYESRINQECVKIGNRSNLDLNSNMINLLYEKYNND